MKDGSIRQQRRGALLLLVLDHPPANALTLPMIEALSQAVAAAAGDPSVSALALVGAGRGFSAGMDPRGFGTPEGAKALGALARRIETCAKPVTAVVHGTCFGAGLELAMACHWRIAAPAAQFGLPEVHLGLPPGAGGSQRLPRLVGGAAALRLLLEGVPIAAPEALALGLLDEIAGGEILEAGLAFAAARPGPRPTAERMGPTDLYGPKGALAQARAQAAGQALPAPARIVDCVEAAGLLPFEQGLVVEATCFADLAASEAAHGLRAAWEAERRAMLVPAAVAAVPAPKVEVLGLWSPDDGATEVVLRALRAGMRVVVAASDREALVAVLNQVASVQDQAVAGGTLTEAARDAEWGLLSASLGMAALAEADVILTEAVAEGLPAARCLAGGGLAPGQPGPALALHAGFAEVALAAQTDPARAALALALARRLGLRVLFTGPGGPILARLTRALTEAALVQEAAGTSAALVEAALAAYRTGAPAPAGSADVLRACLDALAVEGIRLVEDGTARRPLDVDAAAILSGLVPRWQGGPMAWADGLGLLVLRADLWRRAATEPQLYAVPPLLDRLISDSRGLSGLNARR
jgi:3-hydroxyacyl-CoA dehydrogenase